MWDSKPKKITSAILGLEAKTAPTMLFSYYLIRTMLEIQIIL